jgi:hypothetical protein
MKLARYLLLSALVAPVRAGAGDGLSTWQAAAQPAFDPSKAARVSNLAIGRDRIKITLQQGVIQFGQPTEGAVFAGAFRGTGRIQVEPPNRLEAQQLRLFTGKNILDVEFTEAVFSFTDKTYDDVAATVQWEPSAADASLARIYQERQEFRENYGAQLLPRVVKGILSADKQQTEFFFAEVKTTEKGWVFARLDALDPEEIEIGRWLSYGVARFADTWMHFPRGNRSSGEAWQNPVAREDFLPESYQLFATATAGAELRARAVVQLRPQWSGERALQFLLDSNLRVESVKDARSGQTVPFVQAREQKERLQPYGEYLIVFLQEPLVAGQAYALEFVYGGKRVVRSMGPGVYFCQSFGWYPTRLNFALRSNFELNFRSPKQYALVATGMKTAESVDGSELITTWKSEKPIAVAGFAFGEVKIQSAQVGNIEVEVYANKQPDNFMREILRLTEGGGAINPAATSAERERTGFALGTMTPASMAGQIATETANSIKLFEAYFGPYPYKRLAVSTIPFSYGQGWPSLIYLSALSFMDSFQRRQFGITARQEKSITDFFRAHETSHQWWGHKVAWKSYHDQWLSEGFAEFSGNLYLQHRSGPDEYKDRLRQSRKDLLLHDEKGPPIEFVGPIWMGFRLISSESPAAYSRLVYEKGGFVLHMLRMMLFERTGKDPEGRFKAMMREFTQTFDNTAASTEDFKGVAEKYMTPEMNLDGNGRLGWFFNQYVYGTGIPAYDFKYSISDAGGGRWKLTGTVTQSGVPAGWKDVLPLYMEVNKNVFRVGTINILEPVTSFEEMLPFRPDKVILCLNEDTLGFVKQ